MEIGMKLKLIMMCGMASLALAACSKKNDAQNISVYVQTPAEIKAQKEYDQKTAVTERAMAACLEMKGITGQIAFRASGGTIHLVAEMAHAKSLGIEKDCVPSDPDGIVGLAYKPEAPDTIICVGNNIHAKKGANFHDKDIKLTPGKPAYGRSLGIADCAQHVKAGLGSGS
jgi:hypothetical protein